MYSLSSTKCPVNCLVCSSLTSCTTCSYAYTLNNNSCIKCPSNCVSCSKSANMSCSECLQGYLLINNNTCDRCTDANCLKCRISVNICLECRPTYILQGYTCRKGSITNCRNYNGQSCIKCNPGFALLSTGQCFQCISGCADCKQTNLLACDTCLAGTYLNFTDVTCVNCPASCLICSSNTTCSSCANGYSLTIGKTCVAKCSDKNCYKCLKEATVCEMCFSGYQINASFRC